MASNARSLFVHFAKFFLPEVFVMEVEVLYLRVLDRTRLKVSMAEFALTLRFVHRHFGKFFIFFRIALGVGYGGKMANLAWTFAVFTFVIDVVNFFMALETAFLVGMYGGFDYLLKEVCAAVYSVLAERVGYKQPSDYGSDDYYRADEEYNPDDVLIVFLELQFTAVYFFRIH